MSGQDVLAAPFGDVTAFLVAIGQHSTMAPPAESGVAPRLRRARATIRLASAQAPRDKGPTRASQRARYATSRPLSPAIGAYASVH